MRGDTGSSPVGGSKRHWQPIPSNYMRQANIPKVEALISFLKLKQRFHYENVVKALKITNGMPTFLTKGGYLKSLGEGFYEPTDKVDELTVDKYKELLYDYGKIGNNKYKQKQLLLNNALTFESFLNAEKNTDTTKELATAIYNVIKPYL
jgi:hypothetical protein